MEMKMVINEKIITINRPAEEVFAYVGDVSNGHTARLELETSGWMGLAQPLIASGVKREVDENFGILKNILESRVPAVST
jgi:hypothetical protein